MSLINRYTCVHTQNTCMHACTHAEQHTHKIHSVCLSYCLSQSLSSPHLHPTPLTTYPSAGISLSCSPSFFSWMTKLGKFSSSARYDSIFFSFLYASRMARSCCLLKVEGCGCPAWGSSRWFLVMAGWFGATNCPARRYWFWRCGR